VACASEPNLVRPVLEPFSHRHTIPTSDSRHWTMASSSSSSSGSPVVIVNPYTSSAKKRALEYGTSTPTTQAALSYNSIQAEAAAAAAATDPFIGGAEAARRKARQKRRQPTLIQRPGQAHPRATTTSNKPPSEPTLELPLKMNTFERFFAALLRSPVSDFVQSAAINDNAAAAASLALWKTICRRVGLVPPTQPLSSCYRHDYVAHFGLRAALVLEEARHAIAASLLRMPMTTTTTSLSNDAGRNKKSRGGGPQKPGSSCSVPTFAMTKHLVEPSNSHGHVRVTFVKSSPQKFTTAELYHIRPGAVVQCTVGTMVRLGVICNANRDQVMASQCIHCLFFQSDDWHPDTHGTVSIVTQLVTQLRCFEAMTLAHPEKTIGFLHALVGIKHAVHTRFSEDPEDGPLVGKGHTEITHVTPSDLATVATVTPRALSPCLESTPQFDIPSLNATQHDAAQAYLQSAPHTITLVQGPPGTGVYFIGSSFRCMLCTFIFVLVSNSACFLGKCRENYPARVHHLSLCGSSHGTWRGMPTLGISTDQSGHFGLGYALYGHHETQLLLQNHLGGRRRKALGHRAQQCR
jgi:hypothetical protein